MSNQTKNVAETGKGGLQTKHIILILGSLVIVAAAAVTVFLLTRPQPDPNAIPVIDANNVNQILAEVNEKVDKGYFETYMTTEWTFPDGTSPSSDAIMGNAAANNYAFWFEVTLQDGKSVFKSSLLPVGTEIKEIILTEDLDAGQYPAVVTINMVEDDGKTPVDTNAAFNIELIVQS